MARALREAAEVMLRTLHRHGADGEGETHPFIRTAVKGYAAMHDRFRTSVQGTVHPQATSGDSRSGWAPGVCHSVLMVDAASRPVISRSSAAALQA